LPVYPFNVKLQLAVYWQSGELARAGFSDTGE
jgi:hypothetical protein